MGILKVKCSNCNEIIKVDDSKETCFCVNCGNKITLKNIDLAIQMNNTDNIENILKLAQTAYEAGNMNEAYDYYCRLLEHNPDDYKALFFKGICAIKGSDLSDMRKNEALSYIDKSWKLLNENSVDESKIKKHKYRIVRGLQEVSEDIFYSASNFYSKNWECVDAAEFYWGNLIECMDILFYDIEFLENYCDLKDNKTLTFYLNLLNLVISCCIEISKDRENACLDNDTKDRIEIIYNKTVKKIKEYDKYYKEPEINMTRQVGGCYIATAVYGSYDAPEVLVLRYFRDNTLRKSFLGRIFIKVYYALSPPIAKWLKNADRLNNLVRNILDKIVSKLNK
ncbi:TPA: tetratricopeptide repeat protein [Clostridioides difficile]|uniref:tetratricopeptide repeat protein n=2 Tax=Clostridioides difficile TaxID=1496 RepID=UPI000BB1A69C|nr:CFI-box-CTERM domain-containing protein [Clostridioides difficile]PBD80409.1 hypothetical protein BGU03_05015 [Clostridioides difficile]HBF4443252.1 tetratricopeptide repeat protein [Clostridioides difficile]HBG4392753.1 tetratricopeptide repeat protein [Clostridioides difficile]HBH0413582.1 tetratricopeptide repeat protein [Clostridioides difficile]HBH0416360.1 tetratricopeptide repeat protein [Clostridioides difficile]